MLLDKAMTIMAFGVDKRIKLQGGICVVCSNYCEVVVCVRERSA